LKFEISNLQEGLVAVILLLCCFAAVFAVAAIKTDLARARKVFLWARRLFIFAAGLAVLALVLLTAAFLADDFSVAAAAQYSSMDLPFFYKLSAVWAGSAGSLLLWSVGVFLVFVFWLFRSGMEDPAFETTALSIGAGVCAGFSALLVFVARPFAGTGVLIDEGMGLNPLLQNFWMVIHPPLLFIGYSAFLVPFVIAVSCVFAGRMDDTAIYRQLRWWLLFGVCFLGLGIATGARWSYVELGWGGYWAWDPVENASLLPWLVAVAALHAIAGMSAKGGTDKFKLWSIVLAPVPFILCLVATFVTRSGFLSSVHSFGQSPMSLALSVFIGCCFLLWLACIVRACRCPATRSWRVPSRKSAFHLDKAEILSCAVVTLVLAAVIIGVATFWPVIWRIIKGSEAGFVPTSAFYNDVISVAGIVWAFLVGLAGLSDLPRARRGLTIKVLGCCAMGLLCSGSVYRLGGHRLLISLACGICAFSFVAIFLKLLHRLKIRARVAGEIAHLGLLVLVVAIGFSWGERSVQTLVTKGGKVVLGDYEFIYDSFAHKMSDGVTQAGPVIVVKNKDLQKRLWPHTNLYPGNRGREQSASEVAVHTRLSEDIYVSFDGVGQGGGVIITAKIKPFMLWLWLAAVLVIAGAAMAMSGRRARRSGQTVQILGPEPED